MVKREGKLRVCLVASAGGHLSQLLQLESSWNGCDTFCITTSDIVAKKLQKYGRTYAVGECNREHPSRVIRVFFRCIGIIFRQRPDVVISTGAAVGCIACFLGRLSGAKVVWMDSITNVEKMSLSGRMVRHIAHLCLVQWPELTEKYKGIEYAGSVI
ncbi:PssD/Cps14F family polysaccharide biosynthesis glycosyltransferase [Planctomycetota bacterium]